MARGLESVAVRPPGLYGLNTQQASAETDPRWALELTNAVFDSSNRIAARKGWVYLTDEESILGDDVEVIFEYIKSASSTFIISSGGTDIWSDLFNNQITPTGTPPTAANWQFLNFNGKLIGVQQGHAVISWDGVAGTAEEITASTGTLPEGNVGLSAWGRLWVTDETNQIINFCGLLDETLWNTSNDSGSLDTRNVWPDGNDFVVALAAWNNKLVIFGTRSILIYANADNPADATAANVLELEDIIPNTGCIGRDSVVPVGDDLLFLSHNGLRALSRAVEFSNLPMATLSNPVRDSLISDIKAATDATTKCTYNADEGMYLARLGANYWYFDLKQRTEGGDLRAAKWAGIGFKGVFTALAQTDITYLGQVGGIAQYSGYIDGEDTYEFRYKSTWMDLDNDQLKFPKQAHITAITSKPYNVSLQWAYDFVESFRTQVATFPDRGEVGAGWSEAEWSGDVLGNPVALWSGGGADTGEGVYYLDGFGHRIKFGVQVQINGGSFAIHELRVLLRLGRIAA